MGVPEAYLPSTDPIIAYTYSYALGTVNRVIACVPASAVGWSLYELAIYNLAGHSLIEFAQDQSWAISELTWVAGDGFATATTALPNTISAGDLVMISGCSPNDYNTPPAIRPEPAGVTVMSVNPSLNQFTYAMTGVPVAVTVFGSVSETFFVNARAKYQLNSLAPPGAVASTSDSSTSASYLNPEFMKNLTLGDLSLLRTPFGRRYLEIAQKYGPSIWGLTV